MCFEQVLSIERTIRFYYENVLNLENMSRRRRLNWLTDTPTIKPYALAHV